MRLHPLTRFLRCCGPALFVLICMGNATMLGQGTVEHGVMTGNSAGAAASVQSRILIPNRAFPGSSPSAGSSADAGSSSNAASKSATVANETPESIAKANLEYFQTQADPDAANVTLHTVPEHADAWIDGKFVGPAPLDLKLAPGLHQLLVRAPNMRDSDEELNLAAKQTQSVDIPLKANPQNRQLVVLQWPAAKSRTAKKR